MKYAFYGITAALLVASFVGLTGCSNPQLIDQTIGVGPEDNAIMCVIVQVPGRFTGTTVAVKRLEFPANYDITGLTAADVEDLEDRLCR